MNFPENIICSSGLWRSRSDRASRFGTVLVTRFGHFLDRWKHNNIRNMNCYSSLCSSVADNKTDDELKKLLADTHRDINK